MPSWSVLTSGWGERPARERSKAGRRRDLRLDSKEKGRLKEEGEEQGGGKSFMPSAGERQRRRDRNMRLLRDKARTGDGRVGNNAIRILRKKSIYGHDCKEES